MKIGLIEDNRLLARSLTKGLKEEGFTVESFLRGDDGERFFLRHHESFDLLILDLMLPGKSGEAICKSLREHHIEVPILMLTAKDTTESKVSGLMIGADDYLTKPFEFKELVARIYALTRRKPHIESEKVNLTPTVELDFQRKAVYKNHKEIGLSPKEFLILEALVRNPNKALSRDQIFEKVNDFAADNWSNSVDVHIKNIRKKLFKDEKDPIKTVRGVGYCLEPIK